MRSKGKLKLISLLMTLSLLGSLVLFAPVAVAQEKELTLTIWDDYSGQTRDPIVKAAIEKFKEAHPNVKVQRTVRPLDDLTSMIMPAVSAGKGPDVMLVNAGEQMMGPLVRGDDVVNLTPYAEKYGWTEKLYSPSLWNRARYTEDGKTMGRGNLYGVGFDGEIVGVYYNKEIFNDLGLDVPHSIPEFEEACQTIREAGIAPIALAGLKDYRFFHLYALVQGSVMSHYVGPNTTQDYLDDLVLEWRADRTFVNEANREAAGLIRKWVENDYFIEGYSGLSGTDDLALFNAGKAAMFIQGSWYSADIAEADVDAGFFTFPPYEKGEPLPPQLGGLTTPIGINKHSEHKDLAAEYLDILIASDQTVEMQKEMSVLPARVPASLEGVEEDTLFYDLLKAWNEVNEAGNVSHFLDWTTPTMWDTLAQNGRRLMAGKITPDEFVHALEKDYRNWMKNKPAAE